jgi:hypothetical protein
MSAIKRLDIDPFDLDTTFEYDVREVIKMSKEDAEHLRGQLMQASLQVANHINLLNKQENERVWDFPF